MYIRAWFGLRLFGWLYYHVMFRFIIFQLVFEYPGPYDYFQAFGMREVRSNGSRCTVTWQMVGPSRLKKLKLKKILLDFV